MERFLRLIISRFSLVFVVALLLTVLGVRQYANAPKKIQPDINLVFFSASIQSRGAGPEEIYNQIIVPLQKKIAGLEGIERTYEGSYQGGGYVIARYKIGTEEQEAYSDFQEAVNAEKPNFPAVDELTTSRFDPMSDPELTVAVSRGGAKEQDFHNIMDSLKDDLEALDDIDEARIKGVGSRYISIIMDPTQMKTYNLTPEKLSRLISENGSVSGSGSLKGTYDGNLTVLITNTYSNIDDIKNIPIHSTTKGTLHLGDIADVAFATQKRDVFSRFNGKENVAVDIVRKSGFDSMAMTQHVKEVFTSYEKKFNPYGITYQYTDDASVISNDLVSNLNNTVFIAILLVLLTVSVSLNFRASILIAISIPISFFGGLAIFFFFNGDFSIMTVFGLVLSVGLLVDASLVITEYGERHLHSGLRPETAYIEAAKVMAAPLLSSTLTTLLAFLPLFFWPGVSGQFMKSLPLSTFYILVVAYFVSIIVVPTFGVKLAYMTKAHKNNNSEKQTEGTLEDEKDETQAHDLKLLISHSSRIIRGYMKVLFLFLKYPKRLSLAVVLFIFLIIGVFVLLKRPLVFFPDMDSSQIKISVYGHSNYSVEQKDVFLQEITHKIARAYPKEIEGIYSRSTEDREEIGTLKLKLVSPTLRDFSDRELIPKIRKILSNYPGVKLGIFSPSGGPPKEADFSIGMASTDISALKAFDKTFRAYLAGFPEIANLRIKGILEKGVQLSYHLDNGKLQSLGIVPSSVGIPLVMATNGFKVGHFVPKGAHSSYNILLKTPKQWQSDQMVAMMPIFSPTTGKWISLDTLGTSYYRPALERVRGQDGLVTYSYLIDLKEGGSDTKLAKTINAWLKDNRPASIKNRFSANSRSQTETVDYFAWSLPLAQFLIFVVLIAQFNSILYTLITFSAIIMSFGGLFLGLIISGESFGLVMTTLAIFTLSGVIVNNNIVLISTFQQEKKLYPTIYESLVATCFYRVKPVLLTAITSSISLVPSMLAISFSLSEGRIFLNAPTSIFFKNLSISIGSGLTFGALLTLLVTPALIMAYEMSLLKRKEKKEKALKSLET